MRNLTNLESAVLRKLLSGNHPVLALLCDQFDVCRAKKREITGVGFFTDLDVSAYTGVRLELDLKFGDVVAEIDGLEHGAGFVLYVQQGLLTLLEGYTYDEPWPDRIAGFKLRHLTGDERDWEALSKLLDTRT
jgi:hypothetical protein